MPTGRYRLAHRAGADGHWPYAAVRLSLNRWLLDSGRATAPYTASQGTAMGRRGRVRITRDPAGTIWVGGSTITCLNGTATL